MDYGYLCTIVDHSNEPIIGYCFNQECDKPKQICFDCFSKQHSRHQNDCLRFNQIIQMISDCTLILQNLEQSEQIKMQNIIDQFKKNLKFISSEKDRLIKLQAQLRNQDCSQIQNQLEQLKQWRSFTLNKSVKNNNIGIQLDEIKKFEKSFDQFFQPYLNSQTISIKPLEQISQSSMERQNSNKTQEQRNPPQNVNQEQLALECLTSAVDLFKQNNFQDALNFINQALKINSDLEQAYLIKGLSLLHLEQYEEAVDCFNDCLRLDLKIETVYYHKGFCLSALEHFDEAIQNYDKALEIRVDPDFYLKKAQALYQSLKYDKALEIINKALDINTKQQYLQLKGAILHKLGNSAQELNCYLAALGLDQNSSSINHNVGVALHTLKRYEESLKYFDAALAIEPNSPDSLNQKGITLLSLDRYQQALECFESALQYVEKPEYLTNKAKTLNFLKRQNEALQIFEYIRQKFGE
ncbi:unnamed protein product [Paramecium pentaurelia]|uniref:Tetratricopeptide repeat protein n=1 Tax=Paramecium pentaurelia TaxID=43138 RepID=A0A8S1V1S2_9CILI|nr:unnamed protein product [Paramecium pentaurelia]